MNIKILEELAVEEVELSTGTVLIREGKLNKNVYVLTQGKVSIQSKDHRIAVVDQPGTILGEISVLLSAPPVATVVTLEDSKFYVVNDFLVFLEKHPQASVSVAQILACRLVNMNNHFVQIKDELAVMQTNLADYVPVFPEHYQVV